MSRALNDDLPQDRDEEAADWCIRLAEAPLTADEQQAFDGWIADSANSQAFEDALTVWQSTEVLAGKPELLHFRAEALESYRRTNSRRWSRSFGHWNRVAGVAAAILLFVMTSFVMRDPAQLYETGIGERRVAMLDDGSRLSLDAATKVEVRLRDDRRELRLISGRAKFDVAKDPLRPFSVVAGDKMVVATGTSFSVELLRQKVHVFLYEGHVAVLEKPADAAKPIPVRLKATAASADQVLAPGRELIAPLAGQVAIVLPGDAPRSRSWESGQLSFENEPLPSVVERMNRYRNQKLVIEDRATANLRVNGVFIAGDNDALIEALAAFSAVKIVRTDGRVTLSSAGS